ncbi:MAG TPA: periplasmic heavy metal sensor [Candidatus Nitrosotenuis sp.]|nr:periplasmic heavy metal sensor [Candidatus Nitrosotenuis sp.]
MIRKKMLTSIALAALAIPIAVSAQQGPPTQQQLPPDAPAWGRRLGPPMGGQFRGPGMQGRRVGRFQGLRGPGMGRGVMGRGAGLGFLLRDPALRERLGISAEQAEKIQARESAFVQSRIRHRADVQARRLELAQLMAAEKPDRAIIDKKMKELADIQLAGQKSAFEHRLAMRDALTPEQKSKLEEWRKERRQQWQQRGPMAPPMGPRRGPGPQGPPSS